MKLKYNIIYHKDISYKMRMMKEDPADNIETKTKTTETKRQLSKFHMKGLVNEVDDDDDEYICGFLTFSFHL